jgi:hypothetical protein
MIAWLCSWIVLVAEVDERRLVRPLMAVGSSHPASCSDGERASEAGSRRQSREHGGGLSMIPYPRSARSEGAGEWALVEGRRPGFDEAVTFDEAVAEASLVAPSGGPGRKAGSCSSRGCDRGRQRRWSWARYADENSAAGWRCAEEPSIEASPGPRGASFPSSPASGATTPNARTQDAVVRPKLEVRRQAKLHPGIRWRSSTEGGSAALGTAPARERAGAALGNRAVRRVLVYTVALVAEVGETHLFRCRGEPRGNLRGSARGGIA